MLVLGLSGSLREDSHNTRLLHAAAELLPAEASFVRFSDLKAIPPYDPDDDGGERPGPVLHLMEAVRAADAVLVATPEYNHSIPGQLKNALDWLSRPLAESPLREKPAAVIGASTGMFGAVWAQAEARKVLGAIGARVLDRELPVASADEALAEGLDPELERELASLVGELVDSAAPVAV
jgi:chromate reductase, NAD(P)H dehydrogenase (quinone)